MPKELNEINHTRIYQVMAIFVNFNNIQNRVRDWENMY